LAAAAAIVIAAGGLVYLRSSPPAAPLAGHPADATPDFAMYDFTSPTVAWALGFPDRSLGFSVSRTIDGGKHWQRRLSGDHRNGVGAPVLIRFFDEKDGYVANGAGPLLRTSDGGTSWTSLSLPEPIGSHVGFRDYRHGWLITAIVHGQVGPPEQAAEPAHLYSTDDAGDSWQRLPDPPPGGSVFAFRGNSEAWLASGEPGPARVHRSFDGGLSWQARDIPVGKVTTAIGPWNTWVMLLPGDGVIVSVFCECNSAGGFSFTSFDGGASWRLLPSGPGRGLLFTAYQDDVNWWTIDGTTLYRSPDAGQRWTRASDHLPDWHFQPRATDMQHAWAEIGVTEGLGYGLATTADAGLHWTRVAIPQST
jgi:photosystem II stability/assembly factor-like uncharacterized protein